MDRQVGIFKNANQTGLTCLLAKHDSGTLEVQVCSEVLSKFLHTLEGKFANRRFRGLLITSNFIE